MSSNSAVKYEGTWANGLQDGYGCETYSNGGYYQGQMCRGLRHGYGVRKSAPYGDSNLSGQTNKIGFNPSGHYTSQSTMMIHSNSLQSSGSIELNSDDSPKPEDGFKPNIDRTLVSKNGFVLVAKPLDVPMPVGSSPSGSSSKHNGDNSSSAHLSVSGSSKSRRNSLTNKLASARIPGSNQTASLLRGLRLKKQKSTSDLDGISGRYASDNRKHGNLLTSQVDSDTPNVPFTLSPEELDITDPTTVETYTGEWKQDKRNGYGVCDRSDGLKYEGQWHNDMKCGYGVTSFKNGTKEEGKYKNNILIVDSKVKRFFQLGSSNIRQRIDEAVQIANQAQTMALKKAEIADTRAATARDKADQATTAALEADRDSQIAYSVARQYSDTQTQQQQQHQSTYGAYASPFMQAPFQLQEPMGAFEQGGPSLALGPSSALQMRRLSQQQQQLANQNRLQSNHLGYLDSTLSNQAHHQADSNQSQQTLGPVEPFNGRRGSFRGGSISHVQSARSANSSRPASAAGQPMPNHLVSNQMVDRHGTADPFNDLFDHYKTSSNPSGTASSVNFPTRARLRMTGKQASLDFAPNSGTSPTSGYTRAPSVPRHLGSSVYSNEGTSSEPRSQYLSRLQRFRMSSVDQSDEQARASFTGDRSTSDSRQQQFRHLVTSGEELQSADQLEHMSLGPDQTMRADSAGLADQAAGSSYALPQSTSSSSYLFNTVTGQPVPTPSPEGSSLRSPSSQQQQHPSQGHHYHAMMNRDAHSLADERLYQHKSHLMSPNGWSPLDRTEFANYDFTISSAPRSTQRCMKRTASLSRNTPIKSQSGLAGHSSWMTSSLLSGPTGNATSKQTISPEASNAATQEPNQQAQIPAINILNSTSRTCLIAKNDKDAGLEPASELASQRKTSLQVRYDPIELGGLMSREEAAKLSHAQREQRRLQAELAEKRAKRPLLHIYLSFKEFLAHQRLLITVLVFNVFLFKMFADLIM